MTTRAVLAWLKKKGTHDKAAPDKRFLALLPLIERGAEDN